MNNFNLPNLLTVFRFILVFFMVKFFLPLLENTGEQGQILLKQKNNLLFSLFVSFGCYVIASITDFLDGLLARKYNHITKLGTFLDPLADKLLVLSFFLLVYFYLPTRYYLIFFILIAIREVGITFFRIYCLNKNIELKTEKHGKLKTNVQIISQFVLWAIIFYSIFNLNRQNGLLNLIPYVANGIIVIVTTITVYSGISYLKKINFK